MNTLYRQVFVLVAALLLAFSPGAGGADEDVYVCPPCGIDCDLLELPSPGGCGTCGMTLVLKSSLSQPSEAPSAPGQRPEHKRVAVLLFDGVQIIDYTGPWEVFGQAGYEVISVTAEDLDIRTTFGMSVKADYSLEACPEIDIILVPGGGVINTQSDSRVQEWLRERAGRAEYVLSVCNGAYILAKAGLLDGLRATTTRWLVDGLANAAPNITVVRDQRFVDNGKIITSGGLSAGIDAALHLVSKLQGMERAERIAAGLEYRWEKN